MRDETVARNYAETLFDLSEKHGTPGGYGEQLAVLTELLDGNPKFRLFLETPRISSVEKKKVLRKTFGEVFSRPFLNFLLITVDKRRQRLLRDIAREYRALLDDHVGRSHVDVTLASEPDPAHLEMITERLSELLGKRAVPHVVVRPEILGGMIVRTGDTIYDGSVRRRLEAMRRQLLHADLPTAVAAGEEASQDLEV